MSERQTIRGLATDEDVAQQSADDDALLRVARARFQQAADYEGPWRALAEDDLRFLGGEQWPAELKRERDLDLRPCLTINRLLQTHHQVTNEQRQNRPSIKVSPVDDHSDKRTAEVLKGLVRHIWVHSNADVAIDTASDFAVSCGRGWFRVLVDYLDPMSFDMAISVQRVRNTFQIYADPSHQEPDASDMRWAFVVSTMSRDAFNDAYPRDVHGEATTPRRMDAWASIGDQWVLSHQVRVAEYFYIEEEQTEIALLSTGQIIDMQRFEWPLPAGVTITKRRRTSLPSVKWCKINGHTILERTDWLGRWIPLIPILGDERDLNGEVDYSGIVRHAKDPQRMYNFWAASETETIALAPRAPYIGTLDQFAGYEKEWEEANRRPFAYLLYNAVSSGGQPLPPPQRNVQEPPVAAITQARLMAAEDLKSTTGYYDASLGQRSNEVSGRGIRARQQQSQTGSFHFLDNTVRAIRHLGNMLIDLIPKVYDHPMVVRILGEGDVERMVQLNGPVPEGQSGIEGIYDVRVGKYDVTVEAGPSYATKRQEAAEQMGAMVQAYPDLMKIAGDLLASNLDWPGAQELADRLKPEQFRTEEGATPEQQLAQMQQAMQQLQQQLEALNAYAQKSDEARDELEQQIAALKTGEAIKEEELAMQGRELDAKMQIERAKLDIEREKLVIERERIDLEALKLRHATAMAHAARNGKDE